MLRKAHPDMADKVHHTQKRESCPTKKEWHPKPTRADAKTSTDTHMVFVLPTEFYAQSREELPVAQLDLGPPPVIFEKPQGKNYKHLKALYLKVVAEPPKLFQLKCASHRCPADTNSTHFKRNNPLVCRVSARYNHGSTGSKQVYLARRRVYNTTAHQFIIYNILNIITNRFKL
jgi:hypothetical protein